MSPADRPQYDVYMEAALAQARKAREVLVKPDEIDALLAHLK